MAGIDPGSQARIFYLLILGMALLVGLFAAYRGRLSQALQHATIWVLLFLGVIIAYGFSDQIGMQLNPRSAVVLSDDRVVLRRAQDGHFHATLSVNGRDVRFLVDTGATALVLSRRDARRVGIDTGVLAFSTPSVTANGVVFSAPVRLQEVRLGPFTDTDFPAMVNGGDLDVSLLGMRYLDRFARVSVEGDRMVLER